MECPNCQYIMSSFDMECPRCHGKGIQSPPVTPQPTARTKAPRAPHKAAHTVTPDVAAALATLPEIRCGRCHRATTPDQTTCPRCGALFTALTLQLNRADTWTGQWQHKVNAYFSSANWERLSSEFVIFCGFACLYYYGQEFSIYAPVPGTGEIVINLGLMSERQTGILAGIGILVVGTGLRVAAEIHARSKSSGSP